VTDPAIEQLDGVVDPAAAYTLSEASTVITHKCFTTRLNSWRRHRSVLVGFRGPTWEPETERKVASERPLLRTCIHRFEHACLTHTVRTRFVVLTTTARSSHDSLVPGTTDRMASRTAFTILLLLIYFYLLNPPILCLLPCLYQPPLHLSHLYAVQSSSYTSPVIVFCFTIAVN
jgi:hypothetical protein